MKHNFFLPATIIQYDVVISGGGLAGVAAAVSAARQGARVALVESGGELGGDITKGFVPQLLDCQDKGGFVAEIFDHLNSGGHTRARRGARYDETGSKIPGTMIETEYLKSFLDKTLRDLQVEVYYHSLASFAELSEERITALLVTTEGGNLCFKAHTYVDATGNGQLAALAGCEYEFGHPTTGSPQPASMNMLVTGLPEDFPQTENNADKAKLKQVFEEAGIHVSANEIFLIRSAIDGCWVLSVNYQYDVPPDDPLALSQATRDGRIECTEVADAMRKLPGFEKLDILLISSHLGIREGRRIKGQYRLTFEDITQGHKFDDAISLVRFSIDVHAIDAADKRDHGQGKRAIPYHIPYRALLPLGCDNLLLAGRCISGDFYAHASYRVVGNVIPTGEAAGFAAAYCAREGTLPGNVDGKAVREYMESLGYQL
ncbi:MAG: FAD-dependent oxidoreductase [Clostridia bacterium]|nr:FAD-dependent oxidoreductase [Clostridia bacterium]